MTVIPIFTRCVEAIQQEIFIERESAQDKEFHFQNWFKDRLIETSLNFEQGGRNTYPDFSMVSFTDGYELKGLAYPGRDASFDSNSQVPRGFHNGRTIYYVFGRYPEKPDGNRYPVMDLVICDGSFLNADHEYVHKNKSVRGFGSYGDILIRDRKMYVVPTPFHLVEGAAHHRTLILPESVEVPDGWIEVGRLKRVEAPELVVGYTFNLQSNDLAPDRIHNPTSGREHHFRAWRVPGDGADPVRMHGMDTKDFDLETDNDESS